MDNVYKCQYSNGDNAQLDVELFGDKVTENRQAAVSIRDEEDKALIRQSFTEFTKEQESISFQIDELLGGQKLFEERRVYSRSEKSIFITKIKNLNTKNRTVINVKTITSQSLYFLHLKFCSFISSTRLVAVLK